VPSKLACRRNVFAALGAVALLATSLALVVTGSTPASAASGTVTGTVFRDFNSDGFMNTTASATLPAVDVGVSGVTVRAYDASNAEVASATTGADGTYTLDYTTGDATTDVRVQFDTPAGYESGPAGSGSGIRSGTSVQFLADGGTANYGIHHPGDYSTPDPVLVIPLHKGFLNATGTPGDLVAGDAPTLVAVDYSTTGVPTLGGGASNQRPQATLAQTGTVWGVASLGTDWVFSAALFKRHAPVGPGGLGQIYLTEIDSGAPNADAFVTIPNAGTNPRGAGDTTPGYDWFHDVPAWTQVHKVGLGDIDLSADRSTLYAVNLNDRRMYAVPVTPGATAADPPTAGSPSAIAMPLDLPGASAGCAQDQVRPFGLEADASGVWATLTCTGPARADLRGYLYRYDENAGTWGSAPELEFGLGFDRGRTVSGAPANNANWDPWDDLFDGIIGNRQRVYSDPQPLLADLVFDSNGDMVIGIKDHTGDRVGYEIGSITVSDSTLYTGMNAGDTLRACQSGGAWVLENGGACGSRSGFSTTNDQGPGGGEFYEDDFTTIHQQTALGALEQVPGFADVVGTHFDPVSDVYSQGYQRHSNLQGTESSATQLIGAPDRSRPNSPGSFGKADGVGDIEALLADAPIEIGNRVWYDNDGDGIQDPSEAPIEGVTVHLYSGTTLVGTATTDAAGEYYFNAGNVDGGLLPGTEYRIELDEQTDYIAGGPLDGLVLTTNDAGSDDAVDSDGTLGAGSDPRIALTTGGPGVNDHTFDFGFKDPVFDLALRKTLASGQSSQVAPGDDVTFTIEVFNQGDVTARDVEVTDSLPANTSLNDPDWTDNGDGTAKIVVAGRLAPGESTSVDVTITIDADAPVGAFDNLAEISAATDDAGGTRTDVDSTPDTDSTNDTLVDDEIGNAGSDEDDHDIATVTIPPPPGSPAFSLSKTVYRGHDGGGGCAGGELVTGADGDAVTYCFEVSNTGDTILAPVTVSDPDLGIDDGDMTVLSGDLSSMAPGDTAVLFFETTLDGDLVNTATVTGTPVDDQGDPLVGVPDPTADDDATVDVNPPNLDPQPDLAVTKTADAVTVQQGGTVDWTIAVVNHGLGDDPGPVTVVDDLPSGLEFVSVNGDGWECSFEAPTISCVWDAPLLAGESAAPITVRTTATAGVDQKVVNQVNVSSPNPDDNPDDNHDDDDVWITGSGVSDNSDNGSLPRTGASIGGLVLLGLGLVVAGRTLMRQSRRVGG